MRSGRVPRGEVVTYGELAALAGRPGAARAAGTFCAHNRFSLFVPCHRVVGADGPRVGYGSLGRYKRRLLDSRVPLSEDLRNELAGIAPDGNATGWPSSGARAHRRGASTSAARGDRAPLDLASPAAARRAFSLLRELGVIGDSDVPASCFRQVTRYQLRRGVGAAHCEVLREAGVSSRARRSTARRTGSSRARAAGRAYLRGALLGGGTLRSALATPRGAEREPRRRGVRRLGRGAARVELRVFDRGRHALAYAKGNGAIAGVLAAAGASDAVLLFEERVVVGATKARANLANADHASLVRTTRAAHAQLRANKLVAAAGSTIASEATRDRASFVSAIRRSRCASSRSSAVPRPPRPPLKEGSRSWWRLGGCLVGGPRRRRARRQL